MGETYEYAGFVYNVRRDSSGRLVGLDVAPGQHQAAAKMRHIASAMEMLEQEDRKKQRRS